MHLNLADVEFSLPRAALCANASQGEFSSSPDCQENPLWDAGPGCVWVGLAGRCRMLREKKGTNEHLCCQSLVLLADPHASRVTPFCQALPDRSPQGELVPFDDVLRECEGTNNNILRAYQIFNAHVWEQEVFSLLQRQLLLDCPFCL